MPSYEVVFSRSDLLQSALLPGSSFQRSLPGLSNVVPFRTCYASLVRKSFLEAKQVTTLESSGMLGSDGSLEPSVAGKELRFLEVEAGSLRGHHAEEPGSFKQKRSASCCKPLHKETCIQALKRPTNAQT